MTGVFGVPPGADFPRTLVDGLLERHGAGPPEDLARVVLYVNTARMQRRIGDLLADRDALLLPRIRLVTDLGRGLTDPDVPPSVSPIRRRLELARLVGALLDADPALAPRAALYDLADTLAALLDEMQGEGIDGDALREIDLADRSEHWRRRRAFLSIVLEYLDASGSAAPDPERRQRLAVERLIASWERRPPDHPVVLAGSTGSRGATALLMDGVARLPTGAVVLPGFDFDMAPGDWPDLATGLAVEDHPQFRFFQLMQRLGLSAGDIPSWGAATAPSPPRNRLVSLALCPAPVTDRWMRDGPKLDHLDQATSGVSLIEADTPHREAQAIALVMRKAAEDGVRAALITPDRMLTRRVAASLDRWGLVPDDSAGEPLSQSPPGRLLGQIAALFGQRIGGDDLLALLKHPLTHTGADRGPHLRFTRELELDLRRRGPPFPDAGALAGWAHRRPDDPDRAEWAAWVGRVIDMLAADAPVAMSDAVARHVAAAEAIAAGPEAPGAGTLWDETAGEAARRVMDELAREAVHGGTMSAFDYAVFARGVLSGVQVRDPVSAHPGLMIWGTIEARVQGADLVILGGLNEGVWPALPEPDPWLSREMRQSAGLLSPERRIGLAAHDFQQAIAAREVVLTRACRDAEAETVPARWLNRMTNLLGGLPDRGRPALDAMRARGDRWLSLAQALERPEPVQPAPRPAPRPPVAARPRRLWVTDIARLVRDPYAIYARHILGLRPVDPLRRTADAPIRGTILHDIFERFIAEGGVGASDDPRARLMAIADETFRRDAPWALARRLWMARLDRVVDGFLAEERDRAALGTPAATEDAGSLALGKPDFTLSAKADRIDVRLNGTLAIYDYKSGAVPTTKQVAAFDKQLIFEALIAESGGFPGIPSAQVAELAYIGLGAKSGTHPLPLGDPEIAPTPHLDQLRELIGAYGVRELGYLSRQAVERDGFAGDYDHLARHGEWEDGEPPAPEDVG